MKHRGKIVFFAGMLTALGAGWAGFPYAIYRSRPQPVDFSHKVHADKAGSKCDDCHSFRADGSFSGIPTLDKCAGCHAAAMGNTTAERKFIDNYITPQREPQWAAYARQPENVWFSHITHVNRGKVKCESCHADHGSTDTLRPYQEDRVSGYSRDIWRGKKMTDCVACHHQQGLEHSCLDCHK